MNADIIKCALMSYFRFKRQWLCADEAYDGFGGNADVLVDTGTEIHEVEIKVSKYDLEKLELRKYKHRKIKDQDWNKWSKNYEPNKFSLCVPIELQEDAKNWINKVNKQYGLIVYQNKWGDRLLTHPDTVTIVKSARAFKKGYSLERRESICMRLCSALIGERQKRLNGGNPK